MFQGKKVLVLGLAKSGIASIKLLSQLGAEIIAIDNKKKEEIIGIQEIELMNIGIYSGDQYVELLNHVDILVKSPGIPYENIYVKYAQNKKIPIITEVELAYLATEIPFIAITGSNGKTTTTSLVGELLTNGQKKVAVGGNIGIPLSEIVQNEKKEWIAAELSSFQLMGIETFRPKIACLLNVYPAHLDYHGTIENYFEAKMKIFKNQTKQDYAVLNEDSSYTLILKEKIKSTVYTFSTKKEVEKGSFVKDGFIVFKDDKGEEKIITSMKNLSLKGEHNLENVLASVTIAMLVGVEIESILKTLSTFSGVEHRLEFVVNKNNISYYNDSKATNPEAAIRALLAFEEPIIHIAGGLDRGIDFMELIPIYEKKNIRAMIVYGETANKLKKIAEIIGVTIIEVKEVREAVREANKLAIPGDVVLLSPACASWGMYKNFEERGNIFKEEVTKEKKVRI